MRKGVRGFVDDALSRTGPLAVEKSSDFPTAPPFAHKPHRALFVLYKIPERQNQPQHRSLDHNPQGSTYPRAFPVQTNGATSHDLISQISDPRLRERLSAEWKAASHGKKIGLVFEDHLPELLPLYKAKPRRGDLVCRKQGQLKDVWQVKSVKEGVVTCVRPLDEAAPSEPNRAAAETINLSLDEVLVVREFGEPIFPSLVPVDVVTNGHAEGPWHTLIEADNYHALQLLD